MSSPNHRKLPDVLGDSLARGLVREQGRIATERREEALSRLMPPREPSHFNKRIAAQLEWAKKCGSKVFRNDEKPNVRGDGAKPNACRLYFITPCANQRDWFVYCIEIPKRQATRVFRVEGLLQEHAIQRLMQAEFPITDAGNLLLFALANLPPGRTFTEMSGWFHFDRLAARFDRGELCTVIPEQAMDPKVLERHERLTASDAGCGWWFD